MKKEDEAKKLLEEQEKLKKIQEEMEAKTLGVTEVTAPVANNSDSALPNYKYFETVD
jgi:hypothetical protein